ncbi:plasmid partitioning protein [Mesorhizobium hungaricum]|jgi:ParB family transcriptional regulator, chromosome partitioning protein|uniref:Plasmid partitioning protein n=1 Tax=Mesorhizobium hungaricum TaxID=1566387 RepID=A0A1C2E785_9HYPH|nr:MULTISPECIES: ParB N-terminal domain-containing protein [Mesorhizobium]MBN9237289.1 ParB N-terminal domain-containing protein [Mesorhizobium sp.]MDQ0333214.1 ParB family chromosome partitioning protein [Mesorhizobium sp. YL-MeA3-2017]OCX22858.1 plasmid partitioning protein [Mesorhizobium hungaricum]
MYLMKMNPRALVENPNHSRQTKPSPQADALLLASIKAIGIVHPPVVTPQGDGGNGFVIEAGRRRVRLALKAGIEEIDILVNDADNDNAGANGAMRSFAENIVREPLNPVDQWRAIERLVALGWTEDAIAVALALTPRRIKQLRLFANVLPAMLDQMAKGDMPNEQQLRTIASASLDEQKEVWKAHKPSKADPRVGWWNVANALAKTRMYAKDASFDDELARAYGIEWEEDLFGPADEDGRYTTNVEAFLGAQQEWMANHLPKRGLITEANSWGQPLLPPKAERVHGKAAKSDCVAMYLDRDGKVQSVTYRMPEAKKNGKDADDIGTVAKPRPPVTNKGMNMIGDFRTDALREALDRAPIEDDTLMALLILALAGQNVSVRTDGGESLYGSSRLARCAASLFNAEGQLQCSEETLRVAARLSLKEILSCRRNASNSGIVARVAGDAIGANIFLPNMGTADFLSCLSRQALEASCNGTPVLPRARVKDTRAALVEHFKEDRFVHPSALFAPDEKELANWLATNAPEPDEDEESASGDDLTAASEELDEGEDEFREAAE